MKPRTILTIEIEADSYREGIWKYTIRIPSNPPTRKIYSMGRGTPEHVMQLAQEAIREAGR